LHVALRRQIAEDGVESPPVQSKFPGKRTKAGLSRFETPDKPDLDGRSQDKKLIR
jgi:hypothetical protein